MVTVEAQSSGNGISKFTRGHSNPRKCLTFFENILGGSEASDECRNGVCECATQGRAQICESSGHGPMTQSFGIHSINCTYHPYGDQSLRDIEKKTSKEVGQFDTYNQHMDSNVGIKTADLSTYLSKLEDSEYPYITLQYKQDSQSYYSLVVQACEGFFVEILSENASQHDTSKFTFVDEPRLHHDESVWGVDASTADKVVKVSRATTMIDEMIHFYTEVIGGSLVERKSKDEYEYAIVKLDYAEAQLHFVDRKAPTGAEFTVADLEAYVNSVHDEYVKSVNCGFDQHADHHWAYDARTNAVTLSSVSKKLEAGGYKYRWFSLPGNMHQIYAFDPSGWTFQLDLNPGNSVPSVAATYAASCKSDDGCYGQGLCDDVNGGHFMYNTKSWEYFLQ